MLTYEEIKKSAAIKTYITRADESLAALGFTEHSFSHVMHVAETAGYILQTLGFDARTIELAKIAGYLHDIGNLVNRKDHSQSGAGDRGVRGSSDQGGRLRAVPHLYADV